MTESYAGRHSELYDLFYADKLYAEEAAFVDELIRSHSGAGAKDLLEVACGTGRHAAALASAGYSVTATDWSTDMLAQARQKNPGINFERQDMQSLDLGPRRFDAAVCLFDSIGYVRSNERILDVLRGIHRHLRDGGVFVFEFWHAAAMLTSYEPKRVRNFTLDDRKITRESVTQLDIPNQLATVVYSITEKGDDGTSSSFSETQTNRFFLVQEMALLLEVGGFEPLEWNNGFSRGTKIDAATWHIVAAARKVASK